MTQSGITTSTQNLFYLRTVNIVLIYKSLQSLSIQEILNLLPISLLPFLVLTGPGIIQRNIHRHTPRIKTKSITYNPAIVEQGAVVMTVVRIQPGFGMNGLVQEFTTLHGTFSPIIGSPILGPTRPHLIKCRYMVRRIGKPGPITNRYKGDKLMLGMN